MPATKSPNTPDLSNSAAIPREVHNASIAEHFRRPALFLSFLGALTFIVYYVSLSFQFAWDDVFQIVDNPLVRSWSNVPRAFTSDLWFHMNRDQLYYRPLFTTWSIFNYSLFKLQPWGWHLTAILLHIATVCVLFVFARRLPLPYWTAAAAAAIFALHPIHIECVSWISAASDTMVALFYMAAFASFLRFRDPLETKKLRWRALSFVFLACALLTKEMAVTFCAAVAAYVWFFPPATVANFRQRLRQALLAGVPYALVTFLYLCIRKYGLHAVVASPEAQHHTLAESLLTLPYVLAFYLQKLLAPVGLTGLYYTPYVSSAASAEFVLSIVALAVFAGLIWYWQKRTGDPMVSFLGLWTLLTLAPALYLPNFTSGALVRDRYIYLPSVGFILLAAKAIALLPAIGRLNARTLQVATTTIVCLALIGGAVQQIYWESDLVIFERGLQLYPRSTYVKIGLARVLQRTGDNDRAIGLLKEGIAETPQNVNAYYLLAEAYSRVGNQAEGRRVLSQALTLIAHSTKEGALETADLAGLYGRLGDYNNALDLCSKLLSKTPDLLSALYNCGNIDFQVGRYADAEKLLLQAVQQDPGEPSPLYWLGRVHLQAGLTMQAQQDFSNAVAMRPEVYDYHYWLAQTFEKRGDIPGARQQYQKALRIKPESQEAKLRLEALR